MGIIMIFLLAAGLAMDAFAISVTNGMCYKMPVLKNSLYSALAFGIAQGAMPLLGYYAGYAFSGVIERYDHWIALVLLVFIGAKMIIEAVRESKTNADAQIEKKFSFKMLFLQAIATSIDALAVGVSLGVMNVSIVLAASVIAATTFVFCFAGVIIGRNFGKILKEKAEILGGIILIFIGVRIFLEHIGVINF